MLGLGQWVFPAITESGKLAAQAERDKAEAAGLSAQMAALEAQALSPNAVAQVTIAGLRRRFNEQEPQIQAIQQSLVSARNMPAFLENLLAGNKGLQLVSLETLPPEPLVSAGTTAADGVTKSVASSSVQLYKHGVRLKLSGGYRELTAYLAELEQAPQKVLWGGMKLTVSTHPRIVLTLTVYTLSLDKAWMTL